MTLDLPIGLNVILLAPDHSTPRVRIVEVRPKDPEQYVVEFASGLRQAIARYRIWAIA